MTISTHRWAAAGALVLAAGLLSNLGRAQVVQVVDDAAAIPVTRAAFRSLPDTAVPVQEVRWRRGYGYYGGNYGRPYNSYYGSRYYARYPRYYDPYYGGGYGYRSYGPGYGYYRYNEPYYYGRPYGAARVGPFRVFW